MANVFDKIHLKTKVERIPYHFTDFVSTGGNDPVNHPAHYTKGAIECLDAIRASMTDSGYLDFLKGQVIKYIWRYQHKGKPLEDLQKAEFYLKRMIELIGQEQKGGEKV